MVFLATEDHSMSSVKDLGRIRSVQCVLGGSPQRPTPAIPTILNFTVRSSRPMARVVVLERPIAR